MKRRDPGLAGVAGVTEADVEALDQGRTTLLTIADRVGCSKQAVSRKVASMRSTAPTGPAVAPISTSTGSAIPSDAIVIDAMQAVISANLAVIGRAASLLEGGDTLGASAIKALAGAVALARAELAVLGVLAQEDDAEVSTEFVVRILSDEEHDAIKASVELPDDYED